MRNHGRNKRLVMEFWEGLDRDVPASALAQFCGDDVQWDGFQPLRRARGVDEVADVVWGPLRRAIPDLVRRPYVLLGSEFEGSAWVAGTGEMSGTFVQDWLGIEAHGASVRFRFGEFCRLESGRVAEIRMLIDVLDLARQAGRRLVPPSTGREGPVPGPATDDGVDPGERDRDESRATLRLVEDMIFGGLNHYDQRDQASQGLERFWHSELAWHGPLGIGSALGMEEFLANAQGPIVAAIPDRKGVGHRARIAEGTYAASTGWPSLVGTHTDDFLGWPATGAETRWNIMDFWRRDGDRLMENWVLIDLVDVASQAGVDLLGMARSGR